jgi:TolA-binding protein
MPAEGPAGPLVQQFGQLQQQMFDQFQQMMQALLSTVGNLQSDQMGQIRQELDHIREITQELQSLQTATENASPQPSPRRPAEAKAPVADHVPLRSDQTPDPHAHLRISCRIAELQNARQGIWQRVLNILKKPGVV